MATETGKTNKLAMHLDKIAYASALVLGLFIVLIPLFATTEVNNVIRVLPELQSQVEKKLSEDPAPIPVPDLRKIVRDQWEVPSSPREKWIPPWTIDARPAVVKLIKVQGKQVATHEAPQVAKITYLRDPKKMQVFLKIEVTLGKLERTKFTKITLLRADVEKGAAGSFSPIAELKADQLTYDDYAVEPGKLYAYMVSTEVAIDGDPKMVELTAEEVKKDSPPRLLIAAVPYDFAIQILSATGQNPATGAPASLTGEVSFWDYTTSKLVKVSKPKWAEHEKFGTRDRYEIFLIEDGKTRINDLTKRGAEKESLTSQNNRRPVELPAELTPASATEKPAEPEAVKEEPKKAAPKKAEPEEKKTGAPKKAEGSKDKKTKDAKVPDKKKRIVK